MSKIQGYVTLKNWTSNIASRAAYARLRKVELLLQEIADIYGDVYQPVVSSCDAMRAEVNYVREAVAEAKETGAEL